VSCFLTHGVVEISQPWDAWIPGSGVGGGWATVFRRSCRHLGRRRHCGGGTWLDGSAMNWSHCYDDVFSRLLPLCANTKHSLTHSLNQSINQ